MSKCDNELKIIDYLGDELPDPDRSELEKHLNECSECRKMLDAYTAIEKNTGIYYSSIDFRETKTRLIKIPERSQIIRRASIALSLAASFIIGFLIIYES